ncbi:MAG: hypothetical protein AAF330_01595 [Pseudomonadota bacterium]
MPKETIGEEGRVTPGDPFVLFTNPADQEATVDIEVNNCGADAAEVKLHISRTDAPGPGTCIKGPVTLNQGGSLERTNRPLLPGQRIIIETDGAEVDAQMSGVTQLAAAAAAAAQGES